MVTFVAIRDGEAMILKVVITDRDRVYIYIYVYMTSAGSTWVWIGNQSGAAGVWWAHNPQVSGSNEIRSSEAFARKPEGSE